MDKITQRLRVSVFAAAVLLCGAAAASAQNWVTDPFDGQVISITKPGALFINIDNLSGPTLGDQLTVTNAKSSTPLVDGKGTVIGTDFAMANGHLILYSTAAVISENPYNLSYQLLYETPAWTSIDSIQVKSTSSDGKKSETLNFQLSVNLPLTTESIWATIDTTKPSPNNAPAPCSPVKQVFKSGVFASAKYTPQAAAPTPDTWAQAEWTQWAAKQNSALAGSGMFIPRFRQLQWGNNYSVDGHLINELSGGKACVEENGVGDGLLQNSYQDVHCMPGIPTACFSVPICGGTVAVSVEATNTAGDDTFAFLDREGSPAPGAGAPKPVYGQPMEFVAGMPYGSDQYDPVKQAKYWTQSAPRVAVQDLRRLPEQGLPSVDYVSYLNSGDLKVVSEYTAIQPIFPHSSIETVMYGKQVDFGEEVTLYYDCNPNDLKARVCNTVNYRPGGQPNYGYDPVGAWTQLARVCGFSVSAAGGPYPGNNPCATRIATASAGAASAQAVSAVVTGAPRLSGGMVSAPGSPIVAPAEPGRQ